MIWKHGRENVVHLFYCHWDGYPSYIGKILYENYNSYELAEELFQKCKNGISSLYDTVAITAVEDNLYGDMEPIEILYMRFIERGLLRCYDAEYLYLYNSLTGWSVYPLCGIPLSWVDGDDAWYKI